MARARAVEQGANGDGLGGATFTAPPADPLRIVQAAVAGDNLHGVTRQVADACGRTIAISLPAFGPPLLWPEAGVPATQVTALLDYAGALVADRPAALPDGISDAVAVKLGQQVVGVVASLGAGPGPARINQRPWLEAGAAAAAVTTLMRDSAALDATSARRSFLEGLELHPPADVAGLLAHGRRLGVDLNRGAIGLCVLAPGGVDLGALTPNGMAPDAPAPGGVDLEALAPELLCAEVGADRVLGLVPLSVDAAEATAAELVARLRAAGAIAACSAPQRAPELLHDALLEAAVLAEVAATRGPAGGAQEETYRLLVDVLLRAPDELGRLRDSTVAELERYDALHDTELLATLRAFLAHHGSTTETAEAMSLHRHTVGYRLARVQEVAGLSPYESDGRERLSLGLKADRILDAERRRAQRARPA